VSPDSTRECESGSRRLFLPLSLSLSLSLVSVSVTVCVCVCDVCARVFLLNTKFAVHEGCLFYSTHSLCGKLTAPAVASQHHSCPASVLSRPSARFGNADGSAGEAVTSFQCILSVIKDVFWFACACGVSCAIRIVSWLLR